ncbi:MAG: hypothetical protein WBP63_19590, partial [Silvibacterium sp.]
EIEIGPAALVASLRHVQSVYEAGPRWIYERRLSATGLRRSAEKILALTAAAIAEFSASRTPLFRFKRP